MRATQTFRLAYNPAISVSPNEVVANGSLRVQGEHFPASVVVTLGMLFTNGTAQGAVEWLATVHTDRDGFLNANMVVPNKPVGTQFKVVAVTNGGYKATSTNVIKLIAQPVARALPYRGPTGVNVTFSGSSWPAHRAIYLSIKVANSQIEALLPNPTTTDAYGNFSTQVWISQEYAPYSELRLSATDGVSTVRVEAPYYITIPPTPTPVSAPPTPVPVQPSLGVSPNPVAVGQAATATGSRWPAGAAVSIGIVRNGLDVEEALGVARADGDGNFSHSFVLSARWKDAGQLTLVAALPGGQVVTTPLWVTPQSGRIVPSGLPMYVYTLGNRSGPVTFKVRAEGWAPNSNLNISVVSADGSVNVPVTTAAVKQDGTFGAAFNANPAWRGRSDLGVRATTADGRQYSLRYLPYTDIAKIGGGNTYQTTGHNWPANTRIVAVLRIEGEPETEIGSATADTSGRFSLQFNLPRIPDNSKNEIELRAADQPYSAWFDL